MKLCRELYWKRRRCPSGATLGRSSIAGRSNVFGGRSAPASSIAAQMVVFLASPQAIIPKNGVDRDLTDFDFFVLEP
jgi:hypothetical protein